TSEVKISQSAHVYDKNLLLLMPERSNDQGFAMTGSYTCMALTALFVFGSLEEKIEENYIKQVIASGNQVLDQANQVENILDTDFERIIYLGSGSLEGLAQEAQLKVLELTAGQAEASFESSLGFRHGPKSFVNSQTLIYSFLSDELYRRVYALYILELLRTHDIVHFLLALHHHYELVSFLSHFLILTDLLCLLFVFLHLLFIQYGLQGS